MHNKTAPEGGLGGGEQALGLIGFGLVLAILASLNFCGLVFWSHGASLVTQQG